MAKKKKKRSPVKADKVCRHCKKIKKVNAAGYCASCMYDFRVWAGWIVAFLGF